MTRLTKTPNLFSITVSTEWENDIVFPECSALEVGAQGQFIVQQPNNHVTIFARGCWDRVEVESVVKKEEPPTNA